MAPFYQYRGVYCMLYIMLCNASLVKFVNVLRTFRLNRKVFDWLLQ